MATTNYPVGDFLIRIKNAAMAGNKEVVTPNTKLINAVAGALLKAGFLQEVKVDGNDLVVNLAYRSKRPVIMDVKLVSKPGLRVYISWDELDKSRGPQSLLVSTPKGIMFAKDAIAIKQGGELIAEIF
jgi:small subunit ribosomal protein S8